MSINKIHVNNSTTLSLNERFTVMQSVGPKVPTLARRIAPRSRTQSASSVLDKAVAGVSLANRKLLEQLDKKHKMRAALKLKRRSMKANLPSRPRLRNRIGLQKGAANSAIRLTPSGRLSRSNSLTNIATMKADLVQKSALRRSNSTSSLVGRLGSRRASMGGGAVGPRRRLKRNNLVRASSKQNLSRGNTIVNLKRSNSRQSLRRSNSRANLSRSNSRTNLSRSNSRTNLRRSTSRNNLRSPSSSSTAPGTPRNRIARGARRGGNIRSRGGRGLRRSSSISSRLGVRKMPIGRDRIRTLNVRGEGSLRGRGRGRGQVLRRRNSTASLSNLGTSGKTVRQGRLTRPKGRGGSTPARGRSRSRSRSRMQQNIVRGNRSSSRGRGRGRGRGKGGKVELKKEDLDKELDQYMATTRSDMDIL